MDAARTLPDPRESRFDGLHAEAKAALGYAANTLRSIRDGYRTAYGAELSAWHELRDELDRLAREHRHDLARADPAESAEADAEDTRRRQLRRQEEAMAGEIAVHQRELSRLELATRGLEHTWLFLERGEQSIGDDAGPAGLPTDLAMRIVEAQEAERSRLAQEVHDGPAQALTNAIFQAEYIERVLDQDVRLARTELRFLRELLRRELGDVRSFISQLRPPVLDELGLDGSIKDAIANATAITGLPIGCDLAAPVDRLSSAQQTVALRVVQEALQNVRKHAAATHATVTTAVDGQAWVIEIRDDGHGFDVGSVAARGRRNFGLQFMRERAELIGARFEVRSRPNGGTVVRLAIPMAGEESR
jgi:two-component system sensor histidine kinase DegS